uniref:Opsin 8, group member b n=1 Tax=Neogobius melanostomus TaxID=47308 RepID=A0A8C6SII7_9GOBI
SYNSELTPYVPDLSVLSIVGNLLVLIMAVKRSSKLKPPELLSVNLAVTDLGAAITIIMNLVIMPLNVSPFRLCRGEVSWRNAKLLCVWIWIYALLWALLPLLGWGHYGPEPFGLSCTLAWGDMKEESVSFIISLFVFNLALPSVVIICCYFGIAIKLYVTYKKLGISYNRMPNTIKIHRRLLIVSIAVLISMGFIGSWTPYGLVSLWSIFRDSRSIPPEVSLLPCMFAKTSTVYNPLIYYFFSHTFKLEVRKLAPSVDEIHPEYLKSLDVGRGHLQCLFYRQTLSVRRGTGWCVSITRGHTPPPPPVVRSTPGSIVEPWIQEVQCSFRPGSLDQLYK